MISRSTFNQLVAQTCECAVHSPHKIIIEYTNEGLFAFAELVAAAEREACAKLCEKISAEWAERFPVNADRYVPSDGINDCVASIREIQTNSPQD